MKNFAHKFLIAAATLIFFGEVCRASEPIDGMNLVFYKQADFGPLEFSHAALRIEKGKLFWQIELTTVEGRKVDPATIRYYNYRFKNTFGAEEKDIDAVAFSDKSERERVSIESEKPEDKTIAICVNDDSKPRLSLRKYQKCLNEAAMMFSAYEYNFNMVTNNCGHYLERIMQACNLVHCTAFPHSNGMKHGKPKN